MRRRKRSWLSQWNFAAPFLNLSMDCKEFYKNNEKAVDKVFIVVSFIVIVILMFLLVPIMIEPVIAAKSDYDLIKQKEMKALEIQAVEKENEIKYKLMYDALREVEAEKRQEYINNWCDSKKYENELEELNNTIELYDRVWITWWDTPLGGTPSHNFNTGQITKIDGFNIYGTWGDHVINWLKHPNFIKLSAKEYREKRNAEAKALQKKLSKPEEFKSWGTIRY